jgi:hypothetical protein
MLRLPRYRLLLLLLLLCLSIVMTELRMKIPLLITLGSLNSFYQPTIGSQMCHTETMECLLRLDSLINDGILSDADAAMGFGFTLQNATLGSDLLLQAPIIGYIETGSVAERSVSIEFK